MVADAVLRESGLEPEVGLVVRVQGRTKVVFVELDTYVQLRRHITLDGWFVTRIDPEGAFDNVTPEDIIGGRSA